MARSTSIEISALSAYPHIMAVSSPEASDAFQADMGQEPSLLADSSSRTHLIPSLQESVEVREADALQSHPPQPAQDIRSRQTHRRSLELRYWIWEAINAVLLVAMIVAVAVTLRIHDGQPAPQWPLSITINALVSIYAFVFKANMAFYSPHASVNFSGAGIALRAHLETWRFMRMRREVLSALSSGCARIIFGNQVSRSQLSSLLLELL